MVISSVTSFLEAGVILIYLAAYIAPVLFSFALQTVPNFPLEEI